jgi:pre-mRNA-processing factor 17
LYRYFESKQNILMAAQSDKKILQYDLNTGDVVQEYDQHLGGAVVQVESS